MSLSDLQDTIDDLLCHTCQDAARMSAVLNRARRMEYNHASVHALQAKLSVLVAESPPGAPTFDLFLILILILKDFQESKSTPGCRCSV